MLQTLQIKNFKGWSDTGEIKLAPITVLFGNNSSGKTSIEQFLLLLKQSAVYADRKSVFVLKSEHAAVDLGVPLDIIFNHDKSKKLEFGYRWSLEKPQDYSNAINEEKLFFNTIEFAAKIGIVDGASNDFEVDRFSYKLIDCKKSTTTTEVATLGMEKTKSMANKPYKLFSENYELRRTTGRPWNISSPVRFYGFPDEAVAYYQNAGFLQYLNLFHEKLFSSISYLGPIRLKAKRSYEWPGNEPESVGYDGSNTISAMLSAENQKRMLNLKYKAQRHSFYKIIAIALQKMGLIEEFIINKISETRQDYEVKVKTKGANTFVDIPDVGFGISQVLPVIVQLFYAPKNSIIIMEQPELHLHPRAQAGLADVMIDAINSGEDGPRNIQLIIETHSEHFLRRLQRRISEDYLSKDSFAAYFADVNEIPTKLTPLQVDLFGNIVNWPNNFFGDITGDIFAQTEAGFKKRS